MNLETIISRLTERFPVEETDQSPPNDRGCTTPKNVVFYWAEKKVVKACLSLDCGISFYANGYSAETALNRMLRDLTFHFEARLLNAIRVGEIDYPIVDRRYLYDYENHTERAAPDNTIHWWVKGDDDDHWFKCDIHLPYTSLEALGDTLLEAVTNLSEQIAEAFYFETQFSAGDNAEDKEIKNHE
ncbi:hypothetical protein RYA05_00505 [Pseudomonas syringae pv. actinidiae]|nr:hypothetical protein [Pseudomonas syringae pv. actinidiae]